MVAVLSWKQRIALALEGLTYVTLKSLLQRRIGTAGEERKGFNGPVWAGKSYTLYWNAQVVKSGRYPKSSISKQGRGSGIRRRLADLVLCNEDLPEIVPYNNYVQSEPRPLQGTYTKAVFAIECKNNNLDYRWGYPSHVESFDDDIMSRFLWGDTENILGFDVDWERYAGFQNLFPRAVKVLLMPNFDFTDKAKQDRPVEMSWVQRLNVDWRRQTGLMPPSFSPYDGIMWRIKGLSFRYLNSATSRCRTERSPTK